MTVLIGVDVGGTHTDGVVIDGERSARAKALTTPEDFGVGILGAVRAAGAELGLEGKSLLGDAELFVNGTTIVTNALTSLSGAKVGVIVTRGFRDTFRLARSPRLALYDDQLQVNVPDITPRECIVEVDERVGPRGEVIAELDRGNVEHALDSLVEEQGVEALAVCLLWSFKNPAHEQQVRAIARDRYPDLFVRTSSEVHPLIREYERFLTAVFSAYVQRDVASYVDRLLEALRSEGYSRELLFFKGDAGLMTRDEALERPLDLLQSGPAGGVVGAADLARKLGLDEVITSDMGGTSFDVSLVSDEGPSIVSRSQVGRFELGLHLVDVVSIGAGGGSIAWIDSRGVPQVGPASAGSRPGPACYGAGGSEPTVTDALVAMGILDPDGYLGGQFALDADAARAAIADRIADPTGIDLDAAASAIYDLAATNMGYALREVTVNRGLDPTGYTLVGYGGMLPAFGAAIAARLAMRRVILPRHSSAFSALGLLRADYVRRYSQSVEWLLDDGARRDEVNEMIASLLERAQGDAAEAGFGEAAVRTAVGGEFRFVGQTFELEMALPGARLTHEHATDMKRSFVELYERTYGRGTVWTESPVMLLNVRVSATGERQRKPAWEGRPPRGSNGDSASRQVLMPGARESTEVSVVGAQAPDATRQEGPLIVQDVDTTTVVPAGWSIASDPLGNLLLERSTTEGGET